MAKTTDLDQLREQHPTWRFDSVWATACSGPDKRKLTATRDGVVLSAWSAQLLSFKIEREEERTK
jgi:hypothetical protein